MKLLDKTGRKALLLADNSLSWRKRKESYLDGVLLGLLEGTVGKMKYQYNVKGGRIDFRHGGTNPAFVELVVIKHGVEPYAKSNASELWKLTRIKHAKARRRVLLILDASGRKPKTKRNLKRSYNKIGYGRGRGIREKITIMYVHPDKESSFKFIWGK